MSGETILGRVRKLVLNTGAVANLLFAWLSNEKHVGSDQVGFVLLLVLVLVPHHRLRDGGVLVSLGRLAAEGVIGDGVHVDGTGAHGTGGGGEAVAVGGHDLRHSAPIKCIHRPAGKPFLVS